MRYETDAQGLIIAAGQKARMLGHSYVGSAHLLLALAQQQGVGGQMLRFAGFDPALAESMAAVVYGAGTAGLPLPLGYSNQARYVLRSARLEAQRLGCRQVGSAHILLALLRQEKCEARDLLILNNVDVEELFSFTVEYLQWGSAAPGRHVKEAVNTKLLV